MINTTYKVDKEHKVCVCIITTDEGLRVSGVAKCAPEDTFNEEKGRKIAYLRALLTLKKADVKDLQRTINRLMSIRKTYSNVIDKQLVSLSKNVSTIESIVEELKSITL